MDSALSPREIQARIRGGESLEDVAEAAGVPADQIEPFAAPVLAEREHVLGQALGCPVRRTGESSSARELRHVAADGLRRGGIDEDDVRWDAWRNPERQWIVVARFSEDETQREARFRFDLRSRFSIAQDDLARALIGEPGPASHARPTSAQDPDNEPTIGLDESRSTASAPSPDLAPEFPARPIPRQSPDHVEVEQELSLEAAQDDLVGHASQLDVLYDMLSSFDEDSVNVYADLTRPVTDEDLDDDLLSEAFGHGRPPGSTHDEDIDGLPADEAVDDEDDELASGAEESVLPVPDPRPAPVLEAEPKPAPSRRGTRRPQPADPVAEPEQDALVEIADEPKAKPKSRKTRASIPTWDEIVFGGPKPKE